MEVVVFAMGWDGGQGRNRTADASLFRAALYQLSYLATSDRLQESKLKRTVRNIKAGDRVSDHDVWNGFIVTSRFNSLKRIEWQHSGPAVFSGMLLYGLILSVIFEPFFSTKSTKGTGLGLWISKGIIQKYEGRISFRSLRNANGCTTCFRVFLPTSGTFNLVSTSANELSAAGVEVSANGHTAAMQHV